MSQVIRQFFSLLRETALVLLCVLLVATVSSLVRICGQVIFNEDRQCWVPAAGYRREIFLCRSCALFCWPTSKKGSKK